MRCGCDARKQPDIDIRRLDKLSDKAGLKKRFLALFIDYLTIAAWGVILLAINMFIFVALLDGFPAFDEFGMNLISLTMILPVFLFSTIMEAGEKHATIGKRKMKIEVSSVRSKTIVWQVIIRNIIKFLPWQFAHMMIFRGFAFNWALPPFWMAMLILADILPFIWIAVVLIRKDHRGIPDLISKTVVVDSGLPRTE